MVDKKGEFQTNYEPSYFKPSVSPPVDEKESMQKTPPENVSDVESTYLLQRGTVRKGEH